MADDTPLLIEIWRVRYHPSYFAGVVASCLLVRALLSLLRALELQKGRHTFLSGFWQCFRGWGYGEERYYDYWYPFIIGLFELSAFPVLMLTQGWTLIGAWLTLKTVAQWKAWTEARRSFNRFLIGNAAVLFLSALWLSKCLRR